MQNAESRAMVLPVVLKALQKHLRAIDTGILSEPYLAIAILMKCLSLVQTKGSVSTRSSSSLYLYCHMLASRLRVRYSH